MDKINVFVAGEEQIDIRSPGLRCIEFSLPDYHLQLEKKLQQLSIFYTVKPRSLFPYVDSFSKGSFFLQFPLSSSNLSFNLVNFVWIGSNLEVFVKYSLFTKKLDENGARRRGNHRVSL